MARPTLTTPTDRQDVPGVDIDDAPYASTSAVQDDIADLVVSKLSNRLRRVKPVPFLLPGPAKVTAAGPLTFNFIDLGGPPTPNRIWNVMRTAAWGIDPFTAVAGNFFAFIATTPPVDSATEPLFLYLASAPAVTIPNAINFSGHQVTLRYGEHMVLAFKGVPASTSLYSCIQGEEEDLFDFRVDRD